MKIDFVGKRYYFIALSLVLIVVSLISIFTKGFNVGLEFIGGSEVILKTSKDYTIVDVRNKIAELGEEFKKARIIEVRALGQEEHRTFSIIVSPRNENGALRTYNADEKAEISKKLEEILDAKVVSFNEVSGDAADEIKNLTWKAVVFTLLGILVYVALRFKFAFGVGAVVALIHDVIITLGFFSIFGFEMNIAAIAAILTLVGYSVNDTIVVYDRVREFGRKFKGRDMASIVNDSINSVIIRTINTSLTTFFTVLMLLLFSTGSIKSFAFGMTVGVVVGTYSSIFIASPIVIRWGKSI
ncbi:protein translocase subunit secF [Fervidobacterium pennivorans DSM 9078]|jgi:preprotein translocase subunit SecF|uniref:Protein-export membrane protein SecF n=1 Tax=Fervidobacterium pennivorans (strain DSM 9078 / Ven5) TaxID=771875 RepID=H9UE73_FERPD|nr:protein translocase subunit SecF [Fervidobacterium pennivorans]AFG35816.1 protein translocase subunit secF [Fervidobacterium pennivorans DSM 9078]